MTNSRARLPFFKLSNRASGIAQSWCAAQQLILWASLLSSDQNSHNNITLSSRKESWWVEDYLLFSLMQLLNLGFRRKCQEEGGEDFA